MSDSPQRTKVVSVRLTEAEQRALKARADWAGLSLSDYTRDRLLRAHIQPTAAVPPIGSGSINSTTGRGHVWWQAPVRQEGETGYLRLGAP